MHHFAYRNGRLHCEEVALAEIAEAVGTPAYVYSAGTFEHHISVFREAFAPRDVLIAYAVKANANVAVLATLARLGVGADTVSAGEIKRALAAGIPPGRIIFSGVGKTPSEIAFALEVGLRQINVESPSELVDVAAAAQARGKAAPVALRVNPAIGAGGHDKIATGAAEAKFGVSAQEAVRLYAEAAANPWLEPQGLAIHIGSQIRDLGPLRQAFERLRAMTQTLREEGFPVLRLDLGGGLGVPYFNEPEPPHPKAYAAMIEEVFKGLDVDLAFEPGRLIAANAGVLITRVIRRQPRPHRDIVVLDAAMNDLIRPAMYDAYHDLWLVDEPQEGHPTERVDLVGPVCETSDTFARDRAMPVLAPGALAAFMSAGAYGATMASTYNARTLVPEVLVSGNRFAVVRKGQPVEAQIAMETLPPWLNER
jgi:diaminopimelate decarboxylase